MGYIIQPEIPSAAQNVTIGVDGRQRINVTVSSSQSSTVGVSAISGTSMRGYSAYQIARQHGFEGTEQEWLDSLVGRAGYSPKINTVTDTWWAYDDEKKQWADTGVSVSAGVVHFKDIIFDADDELVIDCGTSTTVMQG